MKGHSFYLFDLDHNLINTQSPTFLYHKETGEEVRLETAHYSKIRKEVGLRGEYKDYREDPSEGKSFRYYQDGPFFLEELEKNKDSLSDNKFQLIQKHMIYNISTICHVTFEISDFVFK